MEFPCSKCGACCKRMDIVVSNTPPYKILAFPHKIDENGRCEMLSEDDMCLVYDDRPLICNVKKLGKFLGISEKEFQQDNVDACNQIIKEEGLDSKFLIK